MKQILITRIDDRLIHGQVVTAWIKVHPINKILIIDDELARNSLMSRIYTAAAPIGVSVVLKGRKEAVEFLKGPEEPGEHIMVLVKVPGSIELLLEEGISLDKVILGGMGAKNGRRTFNRNVSASEEEVESFRRIIARGVPIYYQLVPNDKQVNVENLM